MKRFILLVMAAAIAAVVAAFAIWHFSRGHVARTSSAVVAGLLPRETILLAHLPDFNQTRSQFHESDVYQIWREPTVQAFLEKPLSKKQSTGTRQTLRDFESLEMKDAFVAVTSLQNSAWKIVGGFRFKGTAEEAEKIVGGWRAKFMRGAEPKRETVEFQKHQIEVQTSGILTVSSCYDDGWFVAANDIEQLKALLDRIDGRQKDHSSTLAADETFAAAQKHTQASFAGLVFARLDRFFQELLPKVEETSEPSGSPPIYRQIRSFCGTIAFDGGKIRDVLFVGMPQLINVGELSRASLAAATRDAFLYAAGFLNLPAATQTNAGSPHLPAALGQITAPLAAAGITMDDWNAAFGQEFGLIGEWPATAHFPTLIATLPTKDLAKATQLLGTAAKADSARQWTQSDKDGVHYFSSEAGNPFLPLSPTLALSPTMLVAGLDLGTVQSAVGRIGKHSSELAATEIFQTAERSVPESRQAFAYLDTALLYARLDAAIRPMLFMSAAFVPGMGEQVDMDKMPPAEAITRHLNPVVMSQRYDGDGYVAESVGPVTMYQTVAGLGAAIGAGAIAYQHQKDGGLPGFHSFPGVTAPKPSQAASPSPPMSNPSPSPSASAAATP